MNADRNTKKKKKLAFILTKSEAFLKYCRAVSLFWGRNSLPSEYIWKAEGVTFLRKKKKKNLMQCLSNSNAKSLAGFILDSI